MIDGKLHIFTPEGVTLAVVPAGAARRGYAWFIDLIARAVIGFLCMFLLQLAMPGGAGTGMMMVVFFLIEWAYFIVLEVFFNGTSLGKRLTGLQVLREDGLPVGWRESVLRNLLREIDFLPFSYGIGLGFILLDKHARRLGDIVAGTVVVYRDKATVRPALPVVTPLPLPYALTPDEQRALLDLVERVRTVPAQRQTELGDLAEPLTGLKGEASLQRLFQYAAGLTGGKQA
ncbi:Uncharacterized membrane protein YckC, RDD family [Andreprevotia lacus DSM 23236]|jgi:uncharacterized RDD family membrane protein YckC|uniref:Uncharacterized membrane protein YckC, RDD family n=1 Tax=Andreprevotia lacus DSM 23236 TaxID=1121001 RepID=A0A1W1XT00_9NEIS|nr:RDD family protein [Andreprevotia lacus]SMC27083.1 Uncharacterized membrane protein YckC, RDD family [Andreprevotia lacus DSM 23236]